MSLFITKISNNIVLEKVMENCRTRQFSITF